MAARGEMEIVAQVNVPCPECLLVVEVGVPRCFMELHGGVLTVMVTGQVEHVCGLTRGEVR